MSNSKPLSYEGSKAVLRYLKADLRFRISFCCSSLRITEKLVPLHIAELTFYRGSLDRNYMSVNSTDYTFGTYRNYPSGTTVVPWLHQKENEEGGAFTDLDKYGLVDRSADSIVLSGDVDLGQPVVPINFMNDEEMIKELENLVKRKKKTNKISLENDKDRLQSLYNKRDNIQVPYNTMAQLTIENGFGKIQKYHFNGKIYQAEKALYNLLFANRKGIITVRKLHLNFVGNILRFPIGMKLKIRELKTVILSHQLNEGLHQLLDSSSFPLNHLELIEIEKDDVDNDIITNVKRLVLAFGSREMLELIQNLKVDVIHSNSNTTNFVRLVQGWKENQKPIETCFTFGIREEDTFLLKKIGDELNGKRVDERLVEIPMNNESKLQLSHEPVQTERVKWILKLEIVAI